MTMRPRGSWRWRDWVTYLTFFMLASSVFGVMARLASNGQHLVNRYVETRAYAVADTVARRIVHDSLDVVRQRYRRYR